MQKKLGLIEYSIEELRSMKSLLKESGLIQERRIQFTGITANQLLNTIKPIEKEEFLIFANNKYYSIDVDEIRHDPDQPTIFGLDDNGNEKEIKVKDIEFIEPSEISEAVVEQKEKIKKGDRVEVNTMKIKGKDNKSYNVFAFEAAGRGWASISYVASKTPEKYTGTVIRVDIDEFVVKIDPKYLNSIKVVSFAKRPYVSKKDGSFSHIEPWKEANSLKTIYAVNSKGEAYLPLHRFMQYKVI